MSDRPLHVGFPWRLDQRGRSATVGVESYLRGLVETVLFTRPGERVNRPEFGSGLDRLVFAPSGDELARTAQALVHGSLQQWLGDLLRIEDISVEAVESRLEVRVTYSPIDADSAGTDRRVLSVSAPQGGFL